MFLFQIELNWPDLFLLCFWCMYTNASGLQLKLLSANKSIVFLHFWQRWMNRFFLFKYYLSALEFLYMYLLWAKSKKIISSKLKRKSWCILKMENIMYLTTPRKNKWRFIHFQEICFFCVHLLHDGVSIILKGFL